MGIKLEKSKHIKNKLKASFGELQVYNPKGEIYDKLSKLVSENSTQVNLEEGISDVKVDNLDKIFREMFKTITNIEDSEFWDSKSDSEISELLNDADGEFKEVINCLLDIVMEIGQDIRIEDIRKLQLVRNKVVEYTKTLKLTNDIDKSLKVFGIDREKLSKIQNGDIEAIEELQKSLLENKKKKI